MQVKVKPSLPFDCFTPAVMLFVISLLSTQKFLFLPSFLLSMLRLAGIIWLPGLNLTAVFATRSNLRFHEFLVSNFLFSTAFSTIAFLFMVTYLNTTSMTTFYLILGIISIVSTAFQIQLGEYHHKMVIDLRDIVGLSACFIFGSVVVLYFIPVEFWKGWDPWLYAPIVENIVENSPGPVELWSYYSNVFDVNVPGFFYLLAMFKIYCGFDSYSMLRFGGPFMSGLIIALTFMVVRRIESWEIAVISSGFVMLNSFLISRLVMPLREHFAFIYLILVIWLLTLQNEGDFLTNFYKIISIAVIWMLHPLTPLILVGAFAAHVIISRSPSRIMGYFIVTACSFVLSFPMTGVYFEIGKMYILNNLNQIALAVLIMGLTFSCLLVFSFRKVILNVLGDKRFILIFISTFILGSVYAIIHYQFNYQIWTYLNMGKMSICILFLAGTAVLFKEKGELGLFSSLILSSLIISNIVYLGIPFPLFRLTLYLHWPASIFAAKTLQHLFTDSGLKYSLPKKFIPILLISAGFLGAIDFINVNNEQFGSYYNNEDIIRAQTILLELGPNDLLYTTKTTNILLIYAGYPPELFAEMEPEIINLNHPFDTAVHVKLLYPEAERLIYYGTKFDKANKYKIMKILEKHGEMIGEKVYALTVENYF